VPSSSPSVANPLLPPSELLARYAQLTRAAYVEVRRDLLRRQNAADWRTYGSRPIPAWDGGADNYGRQYQPVWPKLAQFLLEHGCGTEEFLRAQVCGYTLPPPQQLATPRALERYRVFQQEHRQCLRAMLLAEAHQFEVCLASDKHFARPGDLPDLWAHCLVRPSSISPLFRVCLAATEPTLRGLVNRFLELAVMQYLEDPLGYQAEWKQILPPGFVDYVQSLRAAIGVPHG
jgi:hypothetical protein